MVDVFVTLREQLEALANGPMCNALDKALWKAGTFRSADVIVIADDTAMIRRKLRRARARNGAKLSKRNGNKRP